MIRSTRLYTYTYEESLTDGQEVDNVSFTAWLSAFLILLERNPSELGNPKHYKIKRKSSERVKKLYVKRMVETSAQTSFSRKISFNFYFTKARNRSSFSISRVRT
ncbi:3-bisphosphoglycerate-independent phosphoglycerate mutase [Striga asiatica]|uniref:3-bisphosphoglycerate-independent phosphoglycerate mutase n=1 Tax=Striga asiatica TaxID=4170 RepID=A0A5A7QJW3_STRAF|nr:3-bisphosphoglycerate-independent phosphoglycerate mutase [Striga asiatica]